MRVLITNNTLASRAGSELYVRDVALGLLNRGHKPIAYSTELGAAPRELWKLTACGRKNLSSNYADKEKSFQGRRSAGMIFVANGFNLAFDYRPSAVSR
jgi:hypothetical protein